MATTDIGAPLSLHRGKTADLGADGVLATHRAIEPYPPENRFSIIQTSNS